MASCLTQQTIKLSGQIRLFLGPQKPRDLETLAVRSQIKFALIILTPFQHHLKPIGLKIKFLPRTPRRNSDDTQIVPTEFDPLFCSCRAKTEMKSQRQQYHINAQKSDYRPRTNSPENQTD